jgi:MYXO-CTERM domain-containing protein
MKALLRGSVAIWVGSMTLFAASTAFADGEACYNDSDCPGTACGDEVCNWTKMAPTPNGVMKVFYCDAAGTQPAGAEGWCTTSADCKCMGQGATCVGTYCTFTKPPAGSGGASSGGASSGGATSTSAGATSTSAGATSTTAGATSTTAGAASTSDSSGSSSGCSISIPGKTSSSVAAALGMLGLGLVFARRRR